MLERKLLFSILLISLTGCMENKSGESELFAAAAKGDSPDKSQTVSPLYPVNGGNFRLALTDAPNPDVSEVWVNIDRIELKVGPNSLIIAQDVGMVDLLTLQNGKLLDLGEVILPIGIKVNQARLILKNENNHLIYKNGDRCDMQTPSQQNSGLKLVSPEFEIREGQAYSMIIDFDAKKSLVFKGNGGCLLKPVLKWASLTSVSQDEVDSEGGSFVDGDDLTDGQEPDDSTTDDSTSDDSTTDDSTTDNSTTDDSTSDDSTTDDSTTDDSTTDDSTTDDSTSDDSTTDDSTTDDSTSDNSTEPVDEMEMCNNTGFDLFDQTQWPNDFDKADYEHCF